MLIALIPFALAVLLIVIAFGQVLQEIAKGREE
jgi:hypothetical protein